jgi:hypothetical protein
MMRTSQSSACMDRLLGAAWWAIDHPKREHGAGRDALLTPCAHWRVYMQSALTQMDGARWAQRHTEAACIATVRVDDSNLEGSDSRHRARRYGDV